MEITQAASAQAKPGPEEWFSGQVWMTELLAAGEPGGVYVLSVQFEPGAHTAWHSHPGGQVLHVVSGVGIVATDGGDRREIRAGDTVRAAAGERHWHGASADRAMTHLAIQPAGTDWYEKVGDDG